MNGYRKRIRLGGNCGGLAWTELQVFFLIFLIGVGVGSSLLISACAQGITGNQSANARVPHSPIHITGNGEFTAANGVSGGSGTSSDPYIIENWEIDANGGNYGISIENTDVYFVIQNCAVKNATYPQSMTSSGIFLNNVQHGTIKDTKVENNMNGIFLYNSIDICILNNSVLNNIPYGIFLYSSTMNNISGNNVSFSPVGIALGTSRFNNLTNNSMWHSGIFPMGTDILDWTTNEVESTNTVNCLPVYFFKNQDAAAVPADAGQVILANCTNFVLSGLSFSNVSVGVQLAFSEYTTITNCSFNATPFGIVAMFSEHTNITSNTISCNGYGIAIEYLSNYAYISENEIAGNYRGIYVYNSNCNIIFNNRVFDNNHSLIFWISENNTIYENTVFNNTHGIHLSFSSHNALRYNNIFENEYEGVFMEGSNSNQLIGNKLLNCGIKLEGYNIENWNTHEIEITNTVNGKAVGYYKNQNGGTIQGNLGQLILANCTNMTVSSLTISNASVGILLGFSSYNTITGNTITGQSCHGLYLWYSHYNSISNNTITNSSQGISLRTANQNSISENNVSGNTYGIYIYNSWKNEIKNNWVCENKEYGVFLTEYSSSNYIHHNYFVGNRDTPPPTPGFPQRGVNDKSQAYDDGDWNNCHDNTTKEGNYWSNWDGQGWGTPNAYPIDGGKASDWYPLGSPVGEEPTIILPITLISIFVAGSFATRKAFKIFQKTFLP